MSYEIQQIRRIRYAIEPSGQYAQEIADGSFSDIKVTEAEMQTNAEMLENATMQQRLDAAEEKIFARRRGGASITSYLNGSGISAASGSVYATTPVGDLLKVSMGGRYINTGSINTGTASGSITYAAGAAFPGGSAVGFINSSGMFEMARIKSVNTGSRVATLCKSFSQALSNPTTIYGTATYYLTQDPNESIQLLFEGLDVDDRWKIAGLNAGFSISTEIGGLPTIAWTFENGATWFTGSIGSGLSEATYSDATPPPFVDGRIHFYPLTQEGSSTNAENFPGCFHASAVEFTPNLTYIDVITECGVNNIARKKRSRSVPVATGKLTGYFENKTAWLDREDVDLYGFSMQIGTEPGNSILISAPRVQIVDVQRVDANELAGYEISFEVLEPIHGTGDLNRSAFSIHFG